MQVRSAWNVEPLAVPFADGLEALKRSRGHRPKDETADVGHIRDATRLCICHGAELTEKLDEKPEANQERRGDNSDAGEPAKQNQRTYLITRVGDQKGNR